MGNFNHLNSISEGLEAFVQRREAPVSSRFRENASVKFLFENERQFVEEQEHQFETPQFEPEQYLVVSDHRLQDKIARSNAITPEFRSKLFTELKGLNKFETHSREMTYDDVPREFAEEAREFLSGKSEKFPRYFDGLKKQNRRKHAEAKARNAARYGLASANAEAELEGAEDQSIEASNASEASEVSEGSGASEGSEASEGEAKEIVESGESEASSTVSKKPPQRLLKYRVLPTVLEERAAAERQLKEEEPEFMWATPHRNKMNTTSVGIDRKSEFMKTDPKDPNYRYMQYKARSPIAPAGAEVDAKVVRFALKTEQIPINQPFEKNADIINRQKGLKQLGKTELNTDVMPTEANRRLDMPARFAGQIKEKVYVNHDHGNMYINRVRPKYLRRMFSMAKVDLASELISMFTPPEEGLEEWNEKVIKGLFQNCSADPKLMLNIKLMQGDIVKDFNKYAINSDFDFDLGAENYERIASISHRNFSKLRLLALVTHYARFCATPSSIFFKYVADICKNTNQVLLLIQFYYLLSKFGKITEMEYETVKRIVAGSPDFSDEALSIFVDYYRNRKSTKISFDTVVPVLESAAQRSSSLFSLYFDAVRSVFDSLNYIVDEKLSDQENADKEAAIQEEVRLLREKFNSITFSIAVRNRSDKNARLLMNEIVSTTKLDFFNLLTLVQFAAAEPSAMEIVRSTVREFDRRMRTQAIVVPPNFALQVVEAFLENLTFYSYHTNILSPLFMNENIVFDATAFESLLRLFGRLEQYTVLATILNNISKGNRIDFTETARKILVKIITNCAEETTKETLSKLAAQFATKGQKAESDEGTMDRFVRDAERDYRQLFENYEENNPNKKITKAQLIPETGEQFSEFRLMKQIAESRPLFHVTSGLVLPKPIKPVKKNNRPVRDRRNLFEHYLERHLLGIDEFSDLVSDDNKTFQDANYEKGVIKKMRKDKDKFQQMIREEGEKKLH